MDEYYLKLLKQFKEANGVNSNDNTNEELLNEFSEWIYRRKRLGETYISLLDDVGLVRYKQPSAIEVGKGKYDSLVRSYNTTIITPYSSGLDVSNKRIINAGFCVDNDGYPNAVTQNSMWARIDVLNDLLFMTQNAYSSNDLENWENLPSRANNFLVGVYGFNFDKDMEKKLKELSKLRDSVGPETIRAYETVDDGYFYLLSSIKKPYAKTLTRTLIYDKKER